MRRALLDGIPHLLGERVLDAVAEAKRRDLIDELDATEIIGAVAGRDRLLAQASRPAGRGPLTRSSKTNTIMKKTTSSTSSSSRGSHQQ